MKKKKRLLRIIIGILLCICMSTGIVPKTASANTVTHVNTYLDSFEQFTADYYLTYSSLDFYLENGVPYHTYVTNTEEDFEETLATWRIATMGADDVASYSQKEVDFYILLIYDVIYQKMHNESGLQNFNTQVDAMMVSTLSELGKDVGEELVELTPDLNIMDENWESVLNTIVNTETFSALMNYSDKILGCVDFAGSVEDLIDKLSMMKEFIDCSEEIDLVLADLYKNANDAQLKEAVRQIRTMATGLLSENEIIAIFGGDLIAGEAKEFALNKLWSVVTSSNAVMAGATIGSKVGKLACNYLFGTDAVVENWYSMDKIYTFEKVLKSQLLNYKSQFEANPTFDNAIVFNQAADMYLNTISTGMEYAIKYVESAKGGGFLGWIYKNFTNDEDFDSLIAMLNQIKTNVDLDIQFVNNDTYNYYLESVEAENLYNVMWEETSCEITEADIKANLKENEDGMFVLTDQTVVTDTTYSDDMLTYANYYHESGTLDLAGQTLTVYGDFYLNGGTVKLNGGSLDVRGDLYFLSDVMNLSGGVLDVGGSVYQSGGKMLIEKGLLRIAGDYRMQSRSTNSVGETVWGTSSGILNMSYEEDNVIVHGGFYKNTINYSVAHADSVLTAGVLTVAGDFIQYGAESSEYPFIGKGTHKVILNGTTPQTLYLGAENSKFVTLEVSNPSGIVVTNYLSVDSLKTTAEVLKIKSNGMKLGTVVVNAPEVEIDGDVAMNSGTLSLMTNKVAIGGNLIHSGGTIIIDKGTLEIKGDYRMQSHSTNSVGETVWGTSSGILNMSYEEDNVIVHGGFYKNTINYSVAHADSVLTAGVLTVAGDFIQYGAESSEYPFIGKGTHKVILNGTTPQTLYLGAENSKFVTLEVSNPSGIVVTNYLSVDSLKTTAEVLKIKSNGMKLGTVVVNAPEVEIDGDVAMNSGTLSLMTNKVAIGGNLIHSGGIIIIDKGTLEIKGDYRMQSRSTNSVGETVWGISSGLLNMSYEEDKVIVHGDFCKYTYNYSSGSQESVFSAGVLTVAGDFMQYGTGSSEYPFNGAGTHKVVLNGTTPQTVYFEAENSKFVTLEVSNPSGIVVTNLFSANSLETTEEVLKIQSKGMKIGTVVVNTPEVVIEGDVTMNTGSLSLMTNRVVIGGNLIHSGGTVIINKGTLEIKGDYRMQNRSTNSVGETVWGISSGLLKMSYDEDKVIVQGDFCKHTYNYSSGSQESVFSAGVLTVAGDFIQYGTGSSEYPFNGAGTHKVVLNGITPQTVYFEATNSKFVTLEVSNPSGIVVTNLLSVNSLKTTEEVLKIQSKGMKLGTVVVNSPEVAIEGDVTMNSGTLSLMNSRVSINGNMIHSGGTVKIMKGILDVSDDYRIQTKGQDEFGDPVWSGASGILSMTYDLGQLHIGGGFYTASSQSHSGHLSAGTMYIKGDFYQGANNANNFKASGTHHVILNGSDPQTVTFESTNSYFNYLHITQPKDCYSFSRDVCWNYLHSELTCTTTEPTCTEQGYSTYTCQFCGTSYRDDFSDALGHKYEDGICVLCGKEEYITIATGYSGNLTWSLTDNGVLVFSGKGSMRNYTYKSEMPWYSYINDIKKIVLEDGVTTIGNYAFYGMPNLTSIEIPDSVAIVGDYAFKNSTALDNVTLPSTLTRLGDSAFFGCSSLTFIDIPASLYTVRAYTFKNCTSLTSVTFHEGNLQKISDAAFYNTGLTEVTLPDCLDILDVYVFKNCADLAHIKIGNGITEIREASLYGTAISYIEVPEGVTKIGSYAFKNCTNLAGISIPTTLTSVGEASFYACTALKELVLPDAVTTIGNYAFRKCEKLAMVDFSANLENIGESSFYGCTELTTLVIPEKVTEIKGYAFKGCIALTAVSLPDSLVNLGESAFYGCTGINSIVIPVNVAAVGDYAFSRCSGLTEVQFIGNAPSIGSGAFSKVTANVYYPADKTGWTAEVMQDYGGTVTWTAK